MTCTLTPGIHMWEVPLAVGVAYVRVQDTTQTRLEMSLQNLVAARKTYVTAAEGSPTRMKALDAMRTAAEQLYEDAQESGMMPLAEQQEIMHAAAVAHVEGPEVQMDIAANAAAGAPLSSDTLLNAFGDESSGVREQALRLIGQLWPNR